LQYNVEYYEGRQREEERRKKGLEKDGKCGRTGKGEMKEKETVGNKKERMGWKMEGRAKGKVVGKRAN